VTDPLIGTIVGGHRIERLLGRGGMGLVYQASELSLERTVALKLIAPELAGEPGFRERFMAESKLAASLDHVNVLPIFHAGEHDGTLYLAMRFVEGDDLRTLVARDGPLPPPRAAAIVAQVAAALDAAHARRLVHRDVKPANVLIGPGDHAYLTDFGVVKDLAITTGATTSGQLLGTVDYAAPEQIRGHGIGPPTDVYALGCVLFFALTGRVVFPLDAAESRLWAHISAPPPPVSSVAPGVPAALDDVLRRALAKAPQERYQAASELAAEVLAAVQRRPREIGVLDRALHSERAIRVALERAPLPYPDVAAEVDGLAALLGRTADRARRLDDALRELPPEEVERRLAEVRAGRDPGKGRLVEALARRLAVQRRMRAKLDAFHAELERIVVELDTLRGRVLAEDDERGLAAGVKGLHAELGALADDIATVGLER
jgi:hypothetical protein